MKFLAILVLLAPVFAHAEPITEIRFKAKILSLKNETATLLYGGKKVRVPASTLSEEARRSSGKKEMEIALSPAQYDTMKRDYFLGGQ